MTWDFWADNKDVITTILAVLSALGTLGGGIWAVFRNRRIRVDVKVFEVISDPSVLLPKLYATENDDGPLADHNIKYQPRDPKRDLQAELKAALNRSRYLLVTAPTGYGKTREAGMLAQTMILEGWRVLRIRTGWLDLPKTLPDELGGNRSRVLIFLDDLNGLFSTGNLTQSPRVENEKSLMLSQLSYHDRLLQVLDMFEGMCTESEIRVIATARSESDQWGKLEYSEKDNLWKRFERVELSAPIDTAIVNLLEDTSQLIDAQANKDDFKVIAHKSDGTYRNILLNLRRWRAQNKEISQDDFNETLNGSWREVYERAVKKNPTVKYIYDAIDVLQRANIELFPALITAVAVKLWGSKNFVQDFIYEKKVIKAGKYLVSEAKILHGEEGRLVPRDGQIEAKGTKVSWEVYAEFLTRLLLEKERGKYVSNSLIGLAQSCLLVGKAQNSVSLARKYTSLNPSSPDGYTLLGEAFSEENIKKYNGSQKTDATALQKLGEILAQERVKKYKEAETAYRKSLELDSTDVYTYNRLGDLLVEIDRNDEAEVVFRKAIEVNSSFIYSYRGLGGLLKKTKRYEEAESAYLKALEIKMHEGVANNLGLMLEDLKRYDEAEDYYRKAIEVSPSFSLAVTNLSRLLRRLNRYDEAEAVLNKAISVNPTVYIYSALGFFLRSRKRFDGAESAYRKAIKIDPSYVFAYNELGLLLEKLKRYDESESTYRKAIEVAPLNFDAYENLSNLLIKLKKYEDAESVARKPISIQPSDSAAYGPLFMFLGEQKRFQELNSLIDNMLLRFTDEVKDIGNVEEVKAFTSVIKEIVDIQSVIESNPLDVESYKKLFAVSSEYEIFDDDYAKSVLCKIVEITPSDFDAHNKLGKLLNEIGEYEESEKEFLKSIELNPTNHQTYIELGNMLVNLKRYDEAEAAFRKAIEIDPLSAYANSNLGYFLHFNNQLEQAETFYRKAVELSPSNMNFQNQLGIILRELGRYGEAESVFNNAIQINPSYVDSYKNLAYLLKITQRYQEEFPLWEKIIEIKPNDYVPYLVICLINKQLGNVVPHDYITKTRYLMPHEKWYDLACLESICDKFDSAFTYLKLAVQEKGFSSDRAWKDRGLQWLRDDPRFVEIVGAKPD